MLNATDHPNRIKHRAHFSSVCGTPRRRPQRGRLHDPGLLLTAIRHIRIAADGQRMAFVAAVRRPTPTTSSCPSRRKGTQNLTARASTGQSLTSAGPRTADCSPLWGWIHTKFLLSSRRRVERSPRVRPIQMLRSFRFRRGCFCSANRDNSAGIVAWTRRTLRASVSLE